MAIEGIRIKRPYAPFQKPEAIPSQNWNDAPLWCLSVNEHWGAFVLGALETLGQAEMWIGSDSEVDAALDQVDRLIDAFIHGECGETMTQVFPDNVFLVGRQFRELNGAAILTIVDSACPMGAYWQQNPAANNTTIEAKFLLDAGDYVFYWNYVKASNGGKADVYIDDVFLFTLDQYNATTTRNNQTSASFTIATAGLHSLKIVTNGQNVLSTNYYVRISYIAIALHP